MLPRWSGPWRFAVAPAATAAGFAAHLLALPHTSIGAFLFFYLGVVLASWTGGRRVGLLTVVLSAVVANYALMSPRWSWSTSESSEIATVMFLLAGSAVALLCSSFRDALVRTKRATEKLRESEAALRAANVRAEWIARFSKENPDPVLRVSSDLRLLFANDAAFSSLGPWWQLRVDGPVPTALAEASRRAFACGLTSQTELVCGDRSFSMTFSPTGSEVNIYAQDITLRRRAEDELRQSEQRLRAMFDNVALGVAEGDADSHFTMVNDRLCEILGYPRPELLRRSVRDLTAPPDRERTEEVLRGLCEGSIDRFDYEKRFLRRDGSPLWVRVTIAALRDANRTFVRSIGTVEDISERRRVEAALRESEDRFRTLADNIAQLAFMADETGSVFWYNKRWYEYTGTTFEEMKGSGWQKVQHPDHVRRVTEGLRRCFDTGEPWEDTFPVRGRDGSYRWFLARALPIRDEAGKVVRWFGTKTDVTDQRESEQALRHSEELRRLALKAAELGTWDFNLRTGEIVWDERSKAILGVSMDRMPYRELLDAHVYSDDRSSVDAMVARALDPAFEGIGTFECRIVRGDGGIRWIEAKGQSFFEGRGVDRTAVRFIGTVADVTSRKQSDDALRASEAQFRQITEVVPQLVWIARGDGKVEHCNQRWYDYTGMSPGSRGELWPPYLVHPDDYEETVRRWRRSLETGEPFQIELRLRRAHTGAYYWFLSRALPVRGDLERIERWFGTCTQIHDQKQALADLADAKLRLEEADRRKDEFLAVLSHELRNPLTPIRNGLYLLDRAAPTSEQAKRAKGIIQRQFDQMTRLVDDLLDVSRITRGKVQLQLEHIDLRQVVGRTVEDHRSVFAARQIVLDCVQPDQAVWVHGDAARLSQALGNLLQNSAKFTNAGGRVSVEVIGEAKTALVRVRDNGAGIAPDLLPQLFHPFTQGDRTLDRSRGGLGLGLALVKGLVELHGGEVRAYSAGIGKGAEFTLRIPADAPVRNEVGNKGPPERPRSRRVLLIEDNPDAAETLREVLELDDHAVEVAFSGRDGIDKARAFLPDVVICDIGLPEMDGYQVARAFRADEDLHDIALVALTGYASAEDVRKAQDAGFDRHLAKPPSLDALERALTELARTTA